MENESFAEKYYRLRMAGMNVIEAITATHAPKIQTWYEANTSDFANDIVSHSLNNQFLTVNPEDMILVTW